MDCSCQTMVWSLARVETLGYVCQAEEVVETLEYVYQTQLGLRYWELVTVHRWRPRPSHIPVTHYVRLRYCWRPKHWYIGFMVWPGCRHLNIGTSHWQGLHWCSLRRWLMVWVIQEISMIVWVEVGISVDPWRISLSCIWHIVVNIFRHHRWQGTEGIRQGTALLKPQAAASEYSAPFVHDFITVHLLGNYSLSLKTNSKTYSSPVVSSSHPRNQSADLLYHQ